MIDIPKERPRAGFWYYGFNCQTCNQKLVFTMDPDDGQGPSQIPDGWIIMTCDSGHEHRHPGSQVKRWLHQ